MDVFAVFIKTSEYVDGDQRSRDYPGHGYGGHTVERTEVKEFKNEAEFKTWIEYKYRDGTSFRAFRCTPITIKTTTTLEYK